MKQLATVFVLVLMLVAGMAFAQTPPATKASASLTAQVPATTAPVLTEVDQLKIENALLKIDAAQKNLDAQKASFTALLTSLQKPGYVIAQGQDGKLAYQPEPKSEPKK